VEAVRKRRLPIIGDGTGRLAIEGGPARLYNVVDDDPAEVSVWLPELARAIGAKPPYRVPVWLGRLAAGDIGVRMMTEQRGSSNAKAKRFWAGSPPTRAGATDSAAASGPRWPRDLPVLPVLPPAVNLFVRGDNIVSGSPEGRPAR
jgi:hypothetical protein